MTQPEIRFDTLGGVKYPEIVAKIPRKYGVRFFWTEFGPAKPLVIKEAKAGRVFIGIQGIWAKHNFTSVHEEQALQIGKEMEAIAKQFPGTRFEFSPFTEHEKSSDYMQKFLAKLQKACPHVRLVNNPDGKGGKVKGFKNELHIDGLPKKPSGPYSIGYDGVSCFDAGVDKVKDLYSDAEEIWYWCFQFNCHENAHNKERNARPTEKLIKSMIFIAENRKAVDTLVDGWICKSHSEQHESPLDPRACKVVLVGPKGKRFKKVTLGGVPLQDGGMTEETDPRQRRNTWRSSKWGFEMPRTQTAVADGVNLGQVDAAFRINEERYKYEQ